MSFLNQLKTQAEAVQAQHSVAQRNHAENVAAVERTMLATWRYFDDLAQHLSVLRPQGPSLTADGRTPWPTMQSAEYRVDARKKSLDGREVFDYVAMGWRLTPKMGVAVQGAVSAGSIPEVERIESRLHAGQVRFERIEKRVPPRNALQSARIEYMTEARGSVRVLPLHSAGALEFRLVCVTGLEQVCKQIDAGDFQTATLDELAKLLVGQNGKFL